MTNEAEKTYASWMLSKATPNGTCLDCHYSNVTYGYCKASTDERAHRFIYRALKGPIPEGKIIMHTCDNRRCINPDHLVIGTYHENVLDMYAKGRNRVGVKTNTRESAITQDRIGVMVVMRKQGYSTRRIAQEFMISQTHVIRLTRRHLDDE